MTLTTLEATLYCMLMTEFLPRSGNMKMKEVVKRLEKVIDEINETSDRLSSLRPMFLTRFTMLLNMIVQIRLENRDEPNKYHIKAILQASRKLNQRQASDLHKLTSAIFFLLYTRCKHSHNLRSGALNECGFFHLVFQTSSNFFHLDKFDYAKAGYLLASKILTKRDHRSWGELQEAVYYKLGILELGIKPKSNSDDSPTKKSAGQRSSDRDPTPDISSVTSSTDLTKAVSYFIEALNNHNKMKFNDKMTPINCEKSIFQIVSKLDERKKQELCTQLFPKLRNIEFLDYVITTAEDLTRSLNKIDGLGSSSIHTNMLASHMSLSLMTSSNSIQSSRGAPREITTSEKASLVVQGIDKIVKILGSKLREAELKTIQRKIDYNRMAISITSLRNSLEKIFDPKAKREIAGYIRTVSILEPVLYKIKVKNNYFRKLYDEMSNIKLEFDFCEALNPDPKQPSQPLKMIAGEELKNHLTYQIGQIELEHGEVKELEITVSFLKCGYYRLRSLNWMLYEAISFKYEVPTYENTDHLKYSVICVNNNAGVLQVNIEHLNDKVNFGEIKKSTLILTNAGSTPIDEVFLASAEPLFTGFGIKSYGQIAANNTIEKDFYIRGTLHKLAIIPLMFVYKTGGNWKYLNYYYEVAVRKPFSGASSVEDLSNGKRLLTIDVIRNSSDRQIEPSQIDLVSLKMSSNVWKIIPDTLDLIKNESMMIISIQIEKRKDIDPDTLYLTRNHAEVRTRSPDLPLPRQRDAPQKRKTRLHRRLPQAPKPRAAASVAVRPLQVLRRLLDTAQKHIEELLPLQLPLDHGAQHPQRSAEQARDSEHLAVQSQSSLPQPQTKHHP